MTATFIPMSDLSLARSGARIGDRAGHPAGEDDDCESAERRS